MSEKEAKASLDRMSLRGVCRALMLFSQRKKGLKYNSGGKEYPRTKPFVKQDPNKI